MVPFGLYFFTVRSCDRKQHASPNNVNEGIVGSIEEEEEERVGRRDGVDDGGGEELEAGLYN